jgi:hypothetical protein
VSEGARSPWRRAFRFALGAFVVLSFVPIWPAWYFGPWEGTGEPASFWTMLFSVPGALEHQRASKLVLVFYGPDLLLPVALLILSLVVGRFWPRLRGAVRPRSAWSVGYLALCLFLLSVMAMSRFGR